MRDQRAFGVASGAAGVDQDGWVFRAGGHHHELVAGRFQRRCISHICQRHIRTQQADTHKLPQLRAARAHKLQVAKRLRVTYGDHGFAVLQPELQRFRAEQLRQWHGHRAHLQHGHVGHRRLHTLRQHNRHPVARAHTRTGQHIGQPVGIALQLKI